MLDKINIEIEDTYNTVTRYLENSDLVITRYYPNGFTGWMNNMKVIKKGIHVVITGSITKYGYDTNAINLDYIRSKQILETLIKDFQIPLTSKIRILEFGFNIPVIKPVSSYLQSFITAKGYEGTTSVRNKQLTFNKHNHVLKFYDKSEDLKMFLEQKHHSWSTEHLLRYEMVLKKQYWTLLGLKKSLTVEDLLNKSIIRQLIILWKQSYINHIVEDEEVFSGRFNTPKDFFDFLILKGVESLGGMQKLMGSDAIEFIVRPSQSKSRAKSTLFDLTKTPPRYKASFIKNDLRKKINFVVQRQLVAMRLQSH